MKCPKDGCNGFVFKPEYGEKRCSNVMCDWNLIKRWSWHDEQ